MESRNINRLKHVGEAKHQYGDALAQEQSLSVEKGSAQTSANRGIGTTRVSLNDGGIQFPGMVRRGIGTHGDQQVRAHINRNTNFQNQGQGFAMDGVASQMCSNTGLGTDIKYTKIERRDNLAPKEPRVRADIGQRGDARGQEHGIIMERGGAQTNTEVSCIQGPECSHRRENMENFGAAAVNANAKLLTESRETAFRGNQEQTRQQEGLDPEETSLTIKGNPSLERSNPEIEQYYKKQLKDLQQHYERKETILRQEVRYVQGGVARNVAECMEKLGTAPFLISVVGEDTAGDLLVAHWQSLGLSIDGIRRCAGVTTPIVSAIFDGKGELAGAVADVHAVEEYLTPEWINQFGEAVRSARVLMLDANLNPAALEAACRLAKMANVPTWFEPVSVTKSIRIKTIAPHVTFTSPNEAELIAMANSLCSNTQDKCLLSGVVEDSCQKSIIEMVQDLKAAILAVLESGIKYIALTLGKHGVVLCSADLYNLPKFQCWSKEMAKAPNKNSYRCSEENMPCKISLKKSLEGCQKLNLHGYKISESWINDPRTNEDCDVRDAGPTGFCSNYNQNSSSSELDLSFVHFPALPASIVSLTGAGDCFVAGVLTGFCMHKDILSSIAYGVAAAKHVVQSDLNVPPVIFEPVLAGDAYRVLVSATKLYIPGH